MKYIDCTFDEELTICNSRFSVTEAVKVFSLLHEKGIEQAVIDIGFGKNAIEHLEYYLGQGELLQAPLEIFIRIDSLDAIFIKKLKESSEWNKLFGIRLSLVGNKSIDELQIYQELRTCGYKMQLQLSSFIDKLDEICAVLDEQSRVLDVQAFYLCEDLYPLPMEKIDDLFQKVNRIISAEAALGFRGYNIYGRARLIVNKISTAFPDKELFWDTTLNLTENKMGLTDCTNVVQVDTITDKAVDNTWTIHADWNFFTVKRKIALWEEYAAIAVQESIAWRYITYFHNEMDLSLEECFDAAKKISSTDRMYFSKEVANNAIHHSRKFKLGIIVPTCNREEYVKVWLDTLGQENYIYNTDIIFFDSSDDNQTCMLIKQVNSNCIYYDRYNSAEKNEKTLDAKVFSAAKKYATKYDYIWICRDRSIPNLHVLYPVLTSCLERQYDFVVVYPHWIGPEHFGYKDYNDCCELFSEQCGNMTSLGSIVFTSRILHKLIDEYPIDPIKNYGLWIPMALFDYIGTHKFRALFFVNNTFNYIPEYSTSFWIKQDTLLWLWLERWPQMIESLPKQYNKIKKDSLKFGGWTVAPLSKLLILPCKANGGFRLTEVWKYRDKFQEVSDTPFWKYACFSCIPYKFVNFYVNIHDKRFFVPIRKISKTIYRIILETVQCLKPSKKRRMPYSGIQYESPEYDAVYENNNVISHKLWCSSNHSAEPWLTIVIPTYHRLDLLKDALRSIQCQKPVMYAWDVIIVDNDAYDGTKNEVQEYIETIGVLPITYYRNDKTLLAGSNMNLGVSLAHGKWVSILHDDDMLASDYLERIEKMIRYTSRNSRKKLGWISGNQAVVRYTSREMEDSNQRVDHALKDYSIRTNKNRNDLLPVYRCELPITGNVGALAPTTGTTFLKDAFIDCGGINEKISISADLILVYKIMKKYRVYRTVIPLGYYRWAVNQSREQLYTIERDLFDFREYVYKKNWFYKLCGFVFRQEHFSNEVIGLMNLTNCVYSEKQFHKFDSIMMYRHNTLRHFVYKMLLKGYHGMQRCLSIHCD